MSPWVIVTGADESAIATLTRNGSAQPLTGATITASIKDAAGQVQSVALSAGAPGADWAAAVVTVEFPAAITALLAAGPAQVQIKAVLAGKTTIWRWVAVTVEAGL